MGWGARPPRPSLPASTQPAAFLPLLLGEGLAPHGHVLLVLHQPQQGRAGLDAQAIVVVLGVAPGNRTSGSALFAGVLNCETGALSQPPPWALGAHVPWTVWGVFTDRSVVREVQEIL